MASCKKQQREEKFPASVSVVNGINDNSSFLSAYFGESQPRIYARLAYIKHGDVFEYATDKTDMPLRLFRNYDTLHADKPFLQTRLPLEAGGIYTHFIYGSPGKVMQKTVKEQIPPRSMSDSTVNLRIINLFDNRAIDVIQLEPEAKTMASNLAYDQLTSFMKVPVNASVASFRFEVRDHASGALIATYSNRTFFPAPHCLMCNGCSKRGPCW